MSSESYQIFSNDFASGLIGPWTIAFLMLVANLLAGIQCPAKSSKSFQGAATDPATVAPAPSNGKSAIFAKNFVRTDLVGVDAGTIAPTRQQPASKTMLWRQVAERFGSLALTVPIEIGRRRLLVVSAFTTRSTFGGGELIAGVGDIVLDPMMRARGHFYRDESTNLALHEQTVGIARISIGGLTLRPLVRNTFGVFADRGFQHATYGSDAETGLAVECALHHSRETKVRFAFTGGVGISAVAHAPIKTQPTFLFVGELLSW